MDRIVEGGSTQAELVGASSLNSLELPELCRTGCFLPNIPFIPFPFILPLEPVVGSERLSSTVSTSLGPSSDPSSAIKLSIWASSVSSTFSSPWKGCSELLRRIV